MSVWQNLGEWNFRSVVVEEMKTVQQRLQRIFLTFRWGNFNTCFIIVSVIILLIKVSIPKACYNVFSTVRQVGTHNYQRDGVKRKSQGVIHRVVPGRNCYPQNMRSHDNLVRRFFLTWWEGLSHLVRRVEECNCWRASCILRRHSTWPVTSDSDILIGRFQIFKYSHQMISNIQIFSLNDFKYSDTLIGWFQIFKYSHRMTSNIHIFSSDDWGDIDTGALLRSFHRLEMLKTKRLKTL